MDIIKATVALVYIFGGIGIFIYLFSRFLRRGIADTGAEKENPFVQNYRVNLKLRTDGAYLLWFFGLMAGLFGFVATVGFVVNEWRPFDFMFAGQ